MNKIYIKYFRDEQHVPFGVFVRLSSGQTGYSFCNPKDHFTKKLGLRIATGRATKYHSFNLVKEIRLYPEYKKLVEAETSFSIRWLEKVNTVRK